MHKRIEQRLDDLEATIADLQSQIDGLRNEVRNGRYVANVDPEGGDNPGEPPPPPPPPPGP